MSRLENFISTAKEIPFGVMMVRSGLLLEKLAVNGQERSRKAHVSADIATLKRPQGVSHAVKLLTVQFLGKFGK